MAPMAKDLKSKPNSKKYQKFSNGFGNPTGTSSSSSASSLTPNTEGKRRRDADNVDGSEIGRLMDSFVERMRRRERPLSSRCWRAITKQTERLCVL